MEFRKIILTTDLSENADAAIPTAVELAKRSAGTITLLFVGEEPLYLEDIPDGTKQASSPLTDPEPRRERPGTADAGAMSLNTLPMNPADAAIWFAALSRDHEVKLRAKAAGIAKKGEVTVVPLIRNGDSAAEILKCAQEQQADCIVMATHGRSGLEHFFMGSVAEKVLRGSACPVISVRSKRED